MKDEEEKKKIEAEEEAKRVAEEEAKKNSGDGNKGGESNEEDLLSRVKAENERMEKNILENKKIIDEQKRIAADAILAGKSSGGSGSGPKPKEEERKIEQAQEYFKETALGDAIKKTNG